jgi:[ribosomal protein S5]-alanine N-acetyltransferase
LVFPRFNFLIGKIMIKQKFIVTPRLQMVEADGALLRAELAGADALARILDCTVPSQWPPEHYDENAVRWALAAEEKLTLDAPWRTHYLVCPGEPATLIGICGFKGPPGDGGRAEIGYSVLAAFQRRGYATEAVAALLRLAYRHGAREVIGETLPELVASQRVLEKCRFAYVGAGSEAGVIRYRHRPAQGAEAA